MQEEEAAHSMCVSLRLDPATLKAMKEQAHDKTLSVVLGASINNTLRALAAKAKDVE